MTRGHSHDSLEALQKRRDSWMREIGSGSEYAAIAPRIVAELDAMIFEAEAVPLTPKLERDLRRQTERTVIDRDNDAIEGDVGL